MCSTSRRKPRLAANLGYPQKVLLERVEAFMQDYYGHAQAIYRISKIIEQRLALTIAAGPGIVGSLKNLLLARRATAPSASTASCCAAASSPPRTRTSSRRIRSA